jgi:hypothetical protein
VEGGVEGEQDVRAVTSHNPGIPAATSVLLESSLEKSGVQNLARPGVAYSSI